MNILEYGTRRQGKSTLALALALTLAERAAENDDGAPIRVIVWDPNDQFKMIEQISINELPAWLEETRSGENWSYHIARVGPFDTAQITPNFEIFTACLDDERCISVIIDEAHQLQGFSWLDENLDRWNRRSTASVAVIQTTHRIVDAHPDSRYHADHVFFFFADLPKELKTVRENWGEEVAAAIPLLKPFQVLHWHREKGGLKFWNVWPDGKRWYIDLGNENT